MELYYGQAISVKCIACQMSLAEREFPAPDAIVKVCGACLESLVRQRPVPCVGCGTRTLVQAGGKCPQCSTDFRKLHGRGSYADHDEDAPQINANS